MPRCYRLTAFILSILFLLSCNWSKAPVAAPTSAPKSPQPGTAKPAHTAVPPTPSAIPPTASPTATLRPEDKVAQWPQSAPEAQGVDSQTLADMLAFIQSKGRNIHSVLVARHGVLVMEAYFSPFRATDGHELFSCTKSVNSTVIELAIEDGLVPPIDTPVYKLFPEIVLDDERKKDITIENLLTMSSGLDWYEEIIRSGINDHGAILTADDPAQYFLSRAVATPPGSTWLYNSGGSHILSVITQNAVGELTADYAKKRLFDPLGMHIVRWRKDTAGYTQGGSGLTMPSRDMARFGQLFLQHGNWEGKQIISEDWTQQATRKHLTAGSGIGYGYQWWVRPTGEYAAMGWGTQNIWVIPQKDMVVVVTAGIQGGWDTHYGLLDKYIIPAAKSEKALPPDPTAQQNLQQQLYAIANPTPQATNPLPARAKQIEGRYHILLNGRFHGWSTFKLYFPTPEEALIDLLLRDEQIQARIGLDGVFRVTETESMGPVAFKGYWENENTLVVIQQIMEDADRQTIHLDFSDRPDGEKQIRIITEIILEPETEEGQAVWY